MSLIKKKLSNGIVCEYWKVISVSVTKDKMSSLLGLINSEGAGEIIESQMFTFPKNLEDYTFNPFKESYELIKQSQEIDGKETNWFADSLDG